jgi:adenosylhomocysteine nucleosidase
MGTVRATLAVETAIRLGDVSMLVSVGLAGGCHADVRVGSVVEAGVVVDTLSGERFAAGDGAGATLVTTHTIASVREKERLFASYGADVVDMEAATVARLAVMRGLSFRALKGVSDGHDFELSSLGRFASPHGHFRTQAFALHTALRPRQWRKTMQLGAASQRALAALTETLKGL